MTHHESDLVVLGAGSAGYATALRAAQLGMTVALIESDKVGGTCLHQGCIPTKALLHAAEVAETTRAAGRFGVRASYDGIDAGAVSAYRDGVVRRLHQGLSGLIGSRGVRSVQGTGRFASPTAISVGAEVYSAARAVVIATGSEPRTLPGLEVGGRVMTSAEALALEEIPRRGVVLGGGVIGVEFASIWRSFGAEVTIVEAAPRLVPGEDEAASRALERALRARGINVLTSSRVGAVVQDADSVSVDLEGGDALTADVLLVAVGRGPRTSGFGLEQIGVELDHGFVKVDDSLETSVPGVHAVGDVVAGLQLAHRGFQHGIFLAEHLAGLAPAPVRDHTIPRVTYSDPEIASVGLTHAQAVERYGAGDVETADYNLAGNGKTQILGGAGFVKLVRQANGPVVGVHMVGPRVSELIGEAQLIVEWEARPDDVAPHLHAHPTQNEALGEAFMTLAGKSLHAHA